MRQRPWATSPNYASEVSTASTVYAEVGSATANYTLSTRTLSQHARRTPGTDALYPTVTTRKGFAPNSSATSSSPYRTHPEPKKPANAEQTDAIISRCSRTSTIARATK